MTNAEARFNKSLRPRKPEGSLGRTAQDVHLDSHTAPELCWKRMPQSSNSTHGHCWYGKDTSAIDFKMDGYWKQEIFFVFVLFLFSVVDL